MTPERDGSGLLLVVRSRAFVISFLLVVSTVSWRSGVYFSGSVDPVVVIKAGLTVLALALAVTAPKRIDGPQPDARYVWLLGAYAAVTTLGGWATGSMLATAVLAIRLLLTGSVVFVLLRIAAPLQAARALIAAMGAVGGIAVLTGVNTITTGRLSGGLPPIHPNEISLLLGAVVIGLVWRCVTGTPRWYDGAGILVLLGLIYATGSRTGLLVLILALLLMVLQAHRLPVPVFLSAVAVVPIGFYVAVATATATGFVDRGGAQNVTTLSSRTIAWQAAFDLGDGNFWQHWLGGGLAMKQVTVQGQWWDQQVLDSTWISALVQAGLIGVGLLIVWILLAYTHVFRCASPERLLWFALLTFVVGRSPLESGMLDSAPAFLLFFLVSLAASTRRSPAEPAEKRRAPYALAG